MTAIYFWTIIYVTVPTIVAQKNLAPEGRTTQSTIDSIYPCGAENAVNGTASTYWNSDLCTCTHTTRHQRIPWWRDDFLKDVYVTNLTMYYRENYGPDLYGFEFYVTNSSSIPPPSSDLCYKDQGDSTNYPDTYQEIHCYTIGRSVVFYISRPSPLPYRAFVLMCYLEINGCWMSTWGPNCNRSCPDYCINQHCYPKNGTCIWGCDSSNCLNNICDQYTGVCSQGCKPGKMGRYCDKNYRNLAVNGEATQFPPGSSPANLVNDGNRATCAAIGTWLQVDLGGLSLITNIYLTFEGSTEIIGNHSIYVTNTSSTWIDGRVLYSGFELPTTDINIRSVCRYVIYVPQIVTEDSELKVCEFEIGGCPAGNYRSDCGLKCPTNCGGPCDIDTAQCIFGCLDGWTGDNCDKDCNIGYYGSQCRETCSSHCLLPPCNHVTGECNGGCKKGWHSENCTKECDHGFYGYNCNNTCSPGCVSYKCDRFEGTCSVTNPQQCNPGWKYDPLCYTPCNDGNYGHNCSEICYCSVPCNKDTGSCSGYCEAGWESTTCNKECSQGYYGVNCESQCGACPCDRFNGDCTGGCEDGYTGHSCKTIAISGVETGYSIGVVIGSSIGCAVISVALTLAVGFCVIKARLNKGSDQSKKSVNTGPCSNTEIGNKNNKKDELQSEQNYDLCGMYSNASYEDYKSEDDQHVYDEMPAVSSESK